MFGAIKNVPLFSINFNKPWWQLLLKKKGTFSLILFATSLIEIFATITPFLVVRIFESGLYSICFIVFAVWMALDLLNVCMRKVNTRFQLQHIYSLYESAHLALLTVDPQYHVHRSSGAILAKVERGARGCEDLLDNINDDYAPLLVGLITLIILLFDYSLQIAGAMILFLGAIFTAGYYFAKYASKHWEKNFLRSDDLFKTTAVENLAQVQLIRSTFATDYRRDRLQETIAENIRTEGKLWMSYTFGFTLLDALYLSSLFLLALGLLWQVNEQRLAAATAIALFLSYLQGTRSIVSSMKLFRKTLRSVTAIRDLFAFIPAFGKQQFPVFAITNCPVKKPHIIEIRAQNIGFDYGGGALFNGHSFILRASKKQPNKLYGVIGPSGSGKSTFLSMIGGQLKPSVGTVLIDDLDIYQIDDATRRQLIALQGQTSTNMRGTVRSNLLLGIPPTAPYKDENLLKVLDDVGLLPILMAHSGLETKIGEGGLNLSGGQRQRLNFAALFLRASFFQPDLILIDEPTSSLDEISEAKITVMLSRLASHAVTLVIAHRLKTIEHAAGLIDLSLLSQDREIRPYKPKELLEVSEYYRALMEGTIALDN